MMKIAKITSLMLAGALTLGLTACGGNAAQDTAPAANDGAAQTAALSGKVTLGGSTSVEKVIGALSESFMQEYPDVDVTYDPTGSGAGITGASEGTLDIGLSSRALKEDETGLTATTFALDGIAIIVHPDNPVADLSVEQIQGLANGTVTNWTEAGGTDAPVALIGREAGSGTRDGFESIVDVKDACKYTSELTSTGAVIAAVASNPNAIGYASLSAVDETVKAVTVDGVAASEQTVQDGTYKIQRPFVMVTKDGAALSEAAQAFLDYATDAAAGSLVADAGAVPVA